MVIFSGTTNGKESLLYFNKLVTHLNCVRVNRRFNLICRIAARQHPDYLTYLEGDRQCSTTTAMPFLGRPIKGDEKITKIDLSIQGFLLNSTTFHSFINLPIHRKNSNNSLTARWKVLQIHSERNKGLGSTLITTTDSSPSENKSFLCIEWNVWLVMNGKVQAVKLTYPQVGHSHGGVDGVFGRLSSSLRRSKNVFNYEDFTDKLKKLNSKDLRDGETISANGFDILHHCYDWSKYFKDLNYEPLQRSLNMLSSKIMKQRCLWIFAERNPDIKGKSRLNIVAYPEPALIDINASVDVLAQVEYCEFDMIEKSKQTKMFADYPIYLDIEQEKSKFEEWKRKNIMSDNDFNSWNHIWNKMKTIQSQTCCECAKLFRKSQQLNKRTFQEKQVKNEIKKYAKKKEKAQRKLKDHVTSCDKFHEIKSFKNQYHAIYCNGKERRFTLPTSTDSSLETNFWKAITDYSKYTNETIYEMKLDIADSVLITANESDEDIDQMIDFQDNPPKWKVNDI